MDYQPPYLFDLTIYSTLGGTMHINKYNIFANFNKWPFIKIRMKGHKNERKE